MDKPKIPSSTKKQKTIKKCAVADCARKYYSRGFCEIHYNRWRKHGNPLTVLKQRGVPAQKRFWKFVRKTDTCWFWTGSKAQGYGKFCVDGKNVPAHRYSYFLAHGEYPKPCCLHLCDNPACVNPAHLKAGTFQENTTDMLQKGRHYVPLGEASKSSKLSADDVYFIKELIAEGVLSLRAIGRKFGCHHENIRAIRDNRSWKCLL